MRLWRAPLWRPNAVGYAKDREDEWLLIQFPEGYKGLGTDKWAW